MTKTVAQRLWDSEIEWRARENAATYTRVDTWEREEAFWDSAASIVESAVSPRECGDYGLARPVNDRTYNALRKIVAAGRAELERSKLEENLRGCMMCGDQGCGYC